MSRTTYTFPQEGDHPAMIPFLTLVSEAEMEGHWEDEVNNVVYLVKKYRNGEALYFYYPIYVIEQVNETYWPELVKHAEWIMDRRRDWLADTDAPGRF